MGSSEDGYTILKYSNFRRQTLQDFEPLLHGLVWLETTKNPNLVDEE